jgi:hypothetical protein
MGSSSSKIKPLPIVYDKIPVRIWDSSMPNTYELRFELCGISHFQETRAAIHLFLAQFGYNDTLLNRRDQLLVNIKKEDLLALRTASAKHPISPMFSWSDLRTKN